MNIRYFIICTLSSILFISPLVSQNYQKLLLREIAENIEDYRNKNITLRLRFKNLDKIFDKIAFYDNKNHDIVFDISGLKEKEDFKQSALNLHKGMEYLVSFRVIEVGANGEIIAILAAFKPFALLKLPDGKKTGVKS